MTQSSLTSCLSSSRKRKRSSDRLHVRFCTRPQIIINTYSQTDYDRSGLFFDIQRQEEFIFALKINFVQKDFLPHKKTNSKRPKLTIDTSNLHGPLYFTSMTTHHPKEYPKEEEEQVDLETIENTRRNSLPLL